jgi:hypothetical protein
MVFPLKRDKSRLHAGLGALSPNSTGRRLADVDGTSRFSCEKMSLEKTMLSKRRLSDHHRGCRPSEWEIRLIASASSLSSRFDASWRHERDPLDNAGKTRRRDVGEFPPISTRRRRLAVGEWLVFFSEILS